MSVDERNPADEGFQVALGMAGIMQLDCEIEAAKAEADEIEERLLFLNGMIVGAAMASARTVERTVWMLPRNEGWFERVVPQLGDQEFKRHFRVTRVTFRYVADKCRQKLERMDTNMRQAISVEKRVAIGLFKLCSSAEDRTVALVFGVGRSSVNSIFQEFCSVVVEVLADDWIQMPTAAGMEEHMQEFFAVSAFPHAVGALDGCHFPVSPPEEHASDYVNYKGWYSVILLAVVDHRYMFTFVSIGWPGRCHDSYAYHRSGLLGIVDGHLFQSPVVIINGTKVPPLLLCDQAFPLTANLNKPFSHRGQLNEAQKTLQLSPLEVQADS